MPEPRRWPADASPWGALLLQGSTPQARAGCALDRRRGSDWIADQHFAPEGFG